MATDAERPDVAGEGDRPSGEGERRPAEAESRLLDAGQRRRVREFLVQLRANPKAMVGAAVVVGLVAVALVEPLVVPEAAIDGTDPANQLRPPSAEHPFGTDHQGRDVLFRVVAGTSYSLQIAVFSVGIATVLGVTLGGVAGYAGGNLDDGIMRPMDVLMSFPPVLFALAVAAILGPSLANTVLAIGIVYTPYFARVARSEVVSVKQRAFVEAARAVGESHRRVLFVEVLPNAAGPIIVQASVSMAYAILLAAALGFLGLGVQPPSPEWGVMVEQSTTYMRDYPWTMVFPGLAIATTVMAFNLFGDGIRDVLDPTIDTGMGVDE